MSIDLWTVFWMLVALIFIWTFRGVIVGLVVMIGAVLFAVGAFCIASFLLFVEWICKHFSKLKKK